MNHKRKEAAIRKFQPLYEQGLTPDELHQQMEADKYSESEVKEIIGALVASESDSMPSIAEPRQAAPKNEKSVSLPDSPYKVYDLWRVEPRIESIVDQVSRQPYNRVTAYEAIKVIRTGVKIEPTVADAINAQSHNSGQRYYEAGTVTNGQAEPIELTTY